VKLVRERIHDRSKLLLPVTRSISFSRSRTTTIWLKKNAKAGARGPTSGPKVSEASAATTTLTRPMLKVDLMWPDMLRIWEFSDVTLEMLEPRDTKISAYVVLKPPIPKSDIHSLSKRQSVMTQRPLHRSRERFSICEVE
jgi:hypothetical protein